MINTLQSSRICFIGAGSMAEAIVRGILQQQRTTPERVTLLNRQNEARLIELEQRYGVHTGKFNVDAIRQADIVMLAMKPKDAESVLGQLREVIKPSQLIISVIAGLTIGTIGRLLGINGLAIVRTMPNTSSTIGLGATGMSCSSSISPEQKQLSLEIFESCGIVHIVDESLLEIVTGVSGSGPAYVYYMMEGMAAAGVQGGLSAEAAAELTLQTFLGAAQMVKSTGENPAELRRKVTSPGGATQAAIEVFDQYKFLEAVTKAIFRSAERAGEMGSQIGSTKR